MTDPLDPNGVAVVGEPSEGHPSPRRAGWSRAGLPVMVGLSDAEDRSPNPDTCPFFRSVDAGGALAAPIEGPDPANRCAAIDRPLPQSVRQQELVCLTAGHVNCPRYLRGALASHHAAAGPVARQGPSSPVLASVIVLVLSAAASVGFLLVRGGIALALPSASPDGSPPASQVAVASPPPTTTPRPSPSPSPSVTPTPEPTPSPTPIPTPSATLPPTQPPTQPPTAPPTPRSNRYDVLVACPDAPRCWIYTVRAGDNFQSIVNWFGVPYDTVVAMNPGLGDVATIHVGDRIRMPPPTR